MMTAVIESDYLITCLC